MNDDSQQTESSNPIVEGAAAPLTVEEANGYFPAPSDVQTPPPAEPPVAEKTPDAPKPAYKFKRMFVAKVAYEVVAAYNDMQGLGASVGWEHASDEQIHACVAKVALYRGRPDAEPVLISDHLFRAVVQALSETLPIE